MSNQTIVCALPVGEMDSAEVRAECDAILGAFNAMDVALRLDEPAADEASAQRALESWPDPPPDLLLLIALRGLSAQTMEAAGLAGRVPCLFWPITGRFALPSSTLAAGALREAGLPVALVFGPPGHPTAVAKARAFVRAATAYTR